ncbi:MAG: hypothetical protein IJ224_05955 [Lachnospiraceae bacterium]|nr:hypothetical protein [Lachnospiraceae bacterium]
MKEKSDNNLIGLNKILPSMLIILFIVSIFLSLTYISKEAGHHCEGENCPICETLLICENHINQLGGFITILLTAYIFITVINSNKTAIEKLFVYKTLITQGVRMNN